MSALTDMIAGEVVPGHGGCPRVVVNEDGWRLAINQLSAGSWTLLGLWGDTGAVHMATLAEDTREIAVVTIPCPDGRFPSVGALHPPAIRLERAIRGCRMFCFSDSRTRATWCCRGESSFRSGTCVRPAP